jgi:transcriptional regulator with XRE-family HTH domain
MRAARKAREGQRRAGRGQEDPAATAREEDAVSTSPQSRSGSGPESIGHLLARLRLARGLSQLRLAELLCASAGVPTVTRHEVSRWEREERVPGAFWLGWLALVLDTPIELLEQAAFVARRPPPPLAVAAVPRTLWQPPAPHELLAAMDSAVGDDLRTLAHTWLAGPPEPRAGSGRPAAGHARPDAVALRVLRRMDDLVGGPDLAVRVAGNLRAAVACLGSASGDRGLLRLVAQWAQLAGWVHADAGDALSARRAYHVGLRTAAAAGDRPLAAHVLGCASHLQLDASDVAEALLLARTAQSGGRARAPASVRALLEQRVALAAAVAGERRAAHRALAASERVAERVHPEREPEWLYWLDEEELSAMTGRCLVALGRPMRAMPLLTSPGRRRGPRTRALYGGWLARAYLELGEVEHACEVAAGALADAVRAGSLRAAAALDRIRPLLLRHRELPVVRGYERLAQSAASYLPQPLIRRRHPVAGAPRSGSGR